MMGIAIADAIDKILMVGVFILVGIMVVGALVLFLGGRRP